MAAIFLNFDVYEGIFFVTWCTCLWIQKEYDVKKTVRTWSISPKLNLCDVIHRITVFIPWKRNNIWGFFCLDLLNSSIWAFQRPKNW